MLMGLISIILSHKCLLSAGRAAGIWVICGCQQTEVLWEVARREGTFRAHGGRARLGSAGAGVKIILLLQALTLSSLCSPG